MENIKLIGEAINHSPRRISGPATDQSGVIITHFGHILDYMKTDRAHVMLGGAIVCSGNPGDLGADKRSGYEGCVGCSTCPA